MIKHTRKQVDTVKSEFKKYLNRDISNEEADDFFGYLLRLFGSIIKIDMRLRKERKEKEEKLKK